MQPQESGKSGLRAHIRSARRATPAEVRAAADRTLVTAILSVVRASAARTVAAYVPMEFEPGGTVLVARLAAAVPRLLLPVLRADRDLDWAVYDTSSSAAGLAAGPFGLLQPTGALLGRDAVVDVDLMLVPALAVDHSGMRLGQGGGSYDRVLPRVSAPTIVPLYPGEYLDQVPAEPPDHPVSAALVAADWYETAHLHWTNDRPIPHHWHSQQ